MRTNSSGGCGNHARAGAMVRGTWGVGRGDRSLDGLHQTRTSQYVYLSPGLGVLSKIQCGATKGTMAKTFGNAVELPGRLDAARETMMLVARRFGVAEAE